MYHLPTTHFIETNSAARSPTYPPPDHRPSFARAHRIWAANQSSHPSHPTPDSRRDDASSSCVQIRACYLISHRLSSSDVCDDVLSPHLHLHLSPSPSSPHSSQAKPPCSAPSDSNQTAPSSRSSGPGSQGARHLLQRLGHVCLDDIVSGVAGLSIVWLVLSRGSRIRVAVVEVVG